MEKNILPLSAQTREIILGSILGDGSLKKHKGYRNARFSFRHSIEQKEYFEWKARQIKEISSAESIFLQKADGFSKNKKLRYQSKALPQLTEIYELTHKRKKFQIKRRWLNQMTALSLAIWWFDDGSLIVNSKRGVICTDGLEKNEVKKLVRYLEIVWGIKTKVAPVNRKRFGKQEQYWRIWFRSSEELKKFLRVIMPYVPCKEMLKKVLLVYKDSQLQQRWISEASKLSKFSFQEVSKALDIKKSKMKHFRE